MTIQILHYEFLGPIKLSEWGPPMEEVVYLLLTREKDNFSIIYTGQSEKTDQADFFTKNDKFKCWLKHAGFEQNLYLAIYPMWKSEKIERKKTAYKIISKYNPVCNRD